MKHFLDFKKYLGGKSICLENAGTAWNTCMFRMYTVLCDSVYVLYTCNIDTFICIKLFCNLVISQTFFAIVCCNFVL